MAWGISHCFDSSRGKLTLCVQRLSHEERRGQSSVDSWLDRSHHRCIDRCSPRSVSASITLAEAAATC